MRNDGKCMQWKMERSGDDEKFVSTKSQQKFLSRGLPNYLCIHTHAHTHTHTHTKAGGAEAGINQFEGHLHVYSCRNLGIPQEECIQWEVKAKNSVFANCSIWEANRGISKGHRGDKIIRKRRKEAAKSDAGKTEGRENFRMEIVRSHPAES